MSETTPIITGNRLLDALPQCELDDIFPHLKPLPLPLRGSLYKPDQRIEDIYFLTHGMVSTVAPLEDGGAVEVGVIGNEGFAGIPALLGVDAATHDVYMQVAGGGLRMAVAAMHAALEHNPAFKQSLYRYTQFYLTQISQTAACNARHGLEHRLARWLLMAHDRVGTDLLPLTHELLSIMLGVQRPGVSMAASTLKQAGVIDYAYGRITVLNRKALERSSCECYRVVKGEFDRLFG
jgi:CRP-like cAMP-binding protein